MPDEQIGIQLYTCLVADLAARPAVLELVATIGYQLVEHYSATGPASVFRQELDAAGLTCISGHQDIPYPYVDATWKQAVDYALTVGQTFIVNPSKPFTTVSEWVGYADACNKAGAVAQQMGLDSIGHHNHTQEFLPISGTTVRPVDVMMQHTDPALFHWQLDIGWAYAALGSVAAVQDELRRYPGRFGQFHVKDIVNEQAAHPGEGEIGKAGFQQIFATAKETGQPIASYLVEDDSATATCVDAALPGYTLLHGLSYTYQSSGSPPAAGPRAGGSPSGTGSRPGTGDGSLAATGGSFATVGAVALAGALALRHRRRGESPGR